MQRLTSFLGALTLCASTLAYAGDSAPPSIALGFGTTGAAPRAAVDLTPGLAGIVMNAINVAAFLAQSADNLNSTTYRFRYFEPTKPLLFGGYGCREIRTLEVAPSPEHAQIVLGTLVTVADGQITPLKTETGMVRVGEDHPCWKRIQKMESDLAEAKALWAARQQQRAEQPTQNQGE